MSLHCRQWHLSFDNTAVERCKTKLKKTCLSWPKYCMGLRHGAIEGMVLEKAHGLDIWWHRRMLKKLD